jgi:hypothetical protein
MCVGLSLALLGVPLAAVASPVGVVYGGLNDRGLPVVIAVSKNRRQVVRATMAMQARCASGNSADFPDNFYKLRISKRRTFGNHYGPATFHKSDGTTYEVRGSVRGRFNAARSKVSGTWRYKETDYDATGQQTDVCDSGTIRWSARQ